MNWIEVRDREAVCMERASQAANKKHDPEISRLLKVYGDTKSGVDAKKIYMERRKKKITRSQMYEYFLENYEHGEDSLVKKSDLKRVSLKSATEILLKSLEGMGD